MLGWFREESRLAAVLLDEIGWETITRVGAEVMGRGVGVAAVLLDEIGWETMTHCLTLTGWVWRGRWRRGGRRERGQLCLADWRRGGRRERGQLCLADWQEGRQAGEGAVVSGRLAQECVGGDSGEGGGRGEGRRRVPSDRVIPSAQACFASSTDERDASNRPAPTFTHSGGFGASRPTG